MKLPIPDDWDGKTFECFQIEWPNSPLWIAMLNGWLSQMGRGRTWNETTGSILDTMAVGLEIWERNQPLRTCAGQAIEPDDQTLLEHIAGVCWFGDCEDTMPCIDISHMLKIENGHLYALDGCCVWQDIGALDPVDGLGDTPLEVPDGDPPTYNACGKAYAGARIIRDVAVSCWEQYDSYPWEFIPLVEEDVHQDLKDLAVIAAVLQAGIMVPLGYTIEEVCSDNFVQWLRCQLYGKFADNAATATEDDFLSARSLIRGHFMPDVYKMNFYDYVMDAIGWQTFAKYIALGASQPDVDCDCPETEEPPIPPTDGVWWSGLVTPEGGDGTMQVISMSSNMRKITLRWTVPSTGEQFTNWQGRLGLVCPANLTSLTMVLTGEYPVADWHSLPFDRWTDPHVPHLDGVTNENQTPGFQGSTGSVWVLTFDSGKPTAYDAGSTNEFRFLPQDTRPNGAVCEFSIEITAWS